jgi:hypothetical protein
MRTISTIPNVTHSWARHCTRVEDVSIYDVAAGLELLRGPHGREWLARGYDATLRAVRNTGALNILAVGGI